ncbi:PAS domain-containing protein [Crateriforma conspicua]|uniref:PAS domain-containing hybrid sensor histidine kinase/response regulator n=1 Tax=Crateriforma conspicua TaxID=2527996 RepID=UPI0011B3AA0C|nr:PAS domain-containing protein [Crateriforma conspicua]
MANFMTDDTSPSGWNPTPEIASLLVTIGCSGDAASDQWLVSLLEEIVDRSAMRFVVYRADGGDTTSVFEATQRLIGDDAISLDSTRNIGPGQVAFCPAGRVPRMRQAGCVEWIETDGATDGLWGTFLASVAAVAGPSAAGIVLRSGDVEPGSVDPASDASIGEGLDAIRKVGGWAVRLACPRCGAPNTPAGQGDDDPFRPNHPSSVAMELSRLLKSCLATNPTDASLLKWVSNLDRFNQAVLETSPDGIKVLDTQGRLLQINRAGLQHMELDDFAPLRGEYWWSLWPDATRSLVKRSIRQAEKDGVARFQAQRPTAKGTMRWWDVVVSPVYDSDQNVTRYVAVSRDVTKQRQQTAELLDREKHLRRVIDHVVGFVGVLDLDGTLTEANQPAITAGGVGREDVIGKKFWDCYWWNYDPSVAERLEQDIRRVQSGETVRYDAMVRMAGDTRMMIDFQLMPVTDDSGNLINIVASGVDISDRYLVEKAIRAANAKWSALFDQSPAFIGVLNLDGTLSEVNHTALQPWGLKRDDMVGHLFWETPWWKGMSKSRQFLRDNFSAVLEGHSFHRDLSYRGPDGSRKIVDIWYVPARNDDGEIMFVIAHGRDVTQQRRNERSIKLNEQRLRDASRLAGFGTLHADVESGMQFFSDELKSLLKYPPDANLDGPLGTIPEWVHPEDLDMIQDHFQNEILRAEDHTSSIEHRVVCYDGEVRMVRLQTRTICGDDDRSGRRPVQIIGTLLDITDQRRYESELRAARIDAESANQAKSAFLANMSHEIRTPMTAILGYADLVAENVSDDETSDYIQTIRRNGNYLLDLINDILDLSKIEADKFEVQQEVFDPARVVEDVRSIMEVRAAEKGLSLQVDYDGRIPQQIYSDPKRLRQILINLVGNAIKFTRTGDVRLVVAHEQQRGDDAVRFEVHDSGIGIPTEQLGKLFQPFSQGDASVTRRFGGTGLGLAISRRLAESLGGDIVVDSEVEHGSTFTVRIDPGDLTDVEMVQPGPLVEIPPSEDDSAPVSLDCHILVTDDRRDIRFLSRRILVDAGATVTEAEDGQVALDKVVESIEQGSPFDIILLDMQMPNLDGYQAAVRLRELGFAGPIVALTADAMQGDMKRCLECGCNDYLAKPINAQNLLRLVARLTRPK